jgi:hypothetical protein
LKAQTTLQEINDFLHEFRTSQSIVFIRRPKNMELLGLLGMTVLDALEIVKGLRACDYFKGPKLDFDSERAKQGETIWEFKTHYESVSLYIKLQKRLNPVGKCVVISFHEDEY